MANIADFMKEAIPIAQFIEKIMEHQLNSSPNCKMHQFSSDDHSKISKLAKEKFETWEWQFGYSPAYSFINKVQLASGTLSINAEIEKCRFTKVRIEGDHYSGFEGEALKKRWSTDRTPLRALKKHIKNWGSVRKRKFSIPGFKRKKPALAGYPGLDQKAIKEPRYLQKQYPVSV